ncbi:hypothetical protein J6590_011822 [Homalodisca vitripennis]|nr:hypothetical protein J6590_011822 [Homalodisca vitripennis]
MPIPKVKATTKRSNRKKRKTAILTESPYKRELMEAINEREEKNRIKQEKARMRKNLKKLEKKKEQKNEDNDDSDDDDDADCACLYCGEFYSKSVEGWVSCCRCKKWAHNSCAGIDSEDDEAVLLCELCDDED